MDLVQEQAARGHDVGVFCDAHFAGERNENLLENLSKHLSLGLVRVPMQRNPHWTDIKALTGLRDFARSTRAEVLHGHGSKGGLYARMGGVIGAKGPVRAYTPHGGSLNYKPGTPIHRLYMGIERLLERGTDLFLFESEYIAERYRTFVCEPSACSGSPSTVSIRMSSSPCTRRRTRSISSISANTVSRRASTRC